jgi:hypothetical protein
VNPLEPQLKQLAASVGGKLETDENDPFLKLRTRNGENTQCIGMHLVCRSLEHFAYSRFGLANPQVPSALHSRINPQRTGNAQPCLLRSERFKAATKPVLVAVGDNSQYARLCDAIDLRTLKVGTRVDSSTTRLVERQALRNSLDAAMVEHDEKALARTAYPFQRAIWRCAGDRSISEASVFRPPLMIIQFDAVELGRPLHPHIPPQRCPEHTGNHNGARRLVSGARVTSKPAMLFLTETCAGRLRRPRSPTDANRRWSRFKLY